MPATVFSGRIHTLNPDQDRPIDAILVGDDGYIIEVGDVDSVTAAHPGVQHTTLDGWVMPGLIDRKSTRLNSSHWE